MRHGNSLVSGPVSLALGNKYMKNITTLYIFSGLPGVGKTALSQRLATHFEAAYLRIDTIEQALRELCNVNVQGEGYRLAYRIAADNLRLGVSVVADSCNPIKLTREEWEAVAQKAEANHVNIVIVCSNRNEHRQRVELRKPSVAGLKCPEWHEVDCREYDDWTRSRIVIDTSGKTEQQCFDELLFVLSNQST